jgi:hypothetical protein
MKLDDPRLKHFYLSCLGIPVIGKYLLGPVLKNLWLLGKRLSGENNLRNKAKAVKEDINVATYSAVIFSLRQRIEVLEKKCQDIQEQQSSQYWQMQYRSQLESAALDGIYMAIAKEKKIEKISK